MKVFHFEQYSPDWWKAREGLPTSSCADKILTPTGKLSAQSKGYINTLIAERLGFGDEPIEPTEWMQRGTLLEEDARAFYEFDTGLTITQVGFITNDDGTFGCSPDGLIEKDDEQIGWETKCPKASTHIGYLLANELPAYYKPQVHSSMAVSGLKKWVFMSYFPGLDPLIVHVDWDEYTDKVSAAIDDFVAQLNAANERLKAA